MMYMAAASDKPRLWMRARSTLRYAPEASLARLARPVVDPSQHHYPARRLGIVC